MNAPAAESIVIVGAGHAGAQLCVALAAQGLGPRVHLVGAEGQLPYQRPPLSKAYLKNPDEPPQWHRPEAWYAEQGISLHLGNPAVALDRAKRRLRLASGAELPYAQLVLATGTRARRLPGLDEGLANVAVLRSLADAQRLRGLLAQARSLTVLGGGFIGLEVAATARAQGLAVQVLEAATRLLQRAVSPELSAHVLQWHQAQGTELHLGVVAGDFEADGTRLAALQVNGLRQPVDVLLLGLGAVPEDTLARDAGLACDNGIVVDALLRTADPAVWAVGDCARWPGGAAGAPLRLESVQNATDQAKAVAAQLAGGAATPFQALPWFWSDQGALRLQMAGLLPPGAAVHTRPGAAPGGFSLLHYLGGRLVCVESVNTPADHIAARKLMEAGLNPAPEVACDPARPLKALLA